MIEIERILKMDKYYGVGLKGLVKSISSILNQHLKYYDLFNDADDALMHPPYPINLVCEIFSPLVYFTQRKLNHIIIFTTDNLSWVVVNQTMLRLL